MRLLTKKVEQAMRNVLEGADPWDDVILDPNEGMIVRCPYCYGTGESADTVKHDNSDGPCDQEIVYRFLFGGKR